MRSAEFWRGSSAYPRLADRSDPRRNHADHERGRLRQRYGQPHAHQLEKGRQQINDGSDIADAAVHCHRLLISVEQQKAVHQQYRDRRGEGQPEGERATLKTFFQSAHKSFRPGRERRHFSPERTGWKQPAGCSVRCYYSNDSVHSTDPLCGFYKLILPYLDDTGLAKKIYNIYVN